MQLKAEENKKPKEQDDFDVVDDSGNTKKFLRNKNMILGSLKINSTRAMEDKFEKPSQKAEQKQSRWLIKKEKYNWS